MNGCVSRYVGVPEACPLGVEVYLISALGWQRPEKAVGVEVVVPVLHVIGGVGWREWSVVSSRVLREVHFSWGARFVWLQGAEVPEMTVWA